MSLVPVTPIEALASRARQAALYRAVRRSLLAAYRLPPHVLVPQPPRRWPAVPKRPLAALLAGIAEAHGLTPADLAGRSRKRAVAAARAEYYARAPRECGVSSAVAARFIGRDHSTLLKTVARRG